MKRYIRASKVEFDSHAVLNANGEVEDVAELVSDPSKIIVYDTWNQMLRDRDNIHEYYIRQNGDKEYEIIKYSRWSKDIYVAYIGPQGYKSLEALYESNPKAREYDVCLIKSW